MDIQDAIVLLVIMAATGYLAIRMRRSMSGQGGCSSCHPSSTSDLGTKQQAKTNSTGVRAAPFVSSEHLIASSATSTDE